MAVTIAAVPEKISRADYMRLIESVGFVVDDLISLTFHSDSIVAEVLARNAEGSPYVERDNVATHHVSIPVED